MNSTAKYLLFLAALSLTMPQPICAAGGNLLAMADFDVAIPSFDVPVPKLPTYPVVEQEKDRCDDAASQIDQLDRSILDTRARYWAMRMREGDYSQIISNPGSEISNRELRREFYALVTYNYKNADFRRPTQFEIYQIKRTMKKMLSLVNSCGGEAPELARAIQQTI